MTVGTLSSKLLYYITRNYPYSITYKVLNGKARSDYDPEEPVFNSESVAKAPELKEFHDKGKYKDTCGKNEPPGRFIRTYASEDSVEKNHDQHIAHIVSYKAMGIKADQNLNDQENNRCDYIEYSFHFFSNSQKATALAAATLRESTP